MISRVLSLIEGLLSQTHMVPFRREKILKKARKTQLPPPKVLVYGVFVAGLFFVGLLILEIIHLVVLGRFEQSVLSLMGYVVTFVIGAFFGARKSCARALNC